MSRRSVRVVSGVLGAIVTVGLFGAASASAHPLGNFSINHLDTLHVDRGHVIDDAIVDTAEIPTSQAAEAIDADGDGNASSAELQQYGDAQCEEYRASLRLTVDGNAVPLVTTATTVAYRPGQAGLRTTRLTCRLEAAVVLDGNHRVEFSNGFAPNRVGWHEIDATAQGLQIVDSPVPTTSVTNGLQTYPVDLLSSPLDVRSATLTIAPGTAATAVVAPSKPSQSTFSKAIGPFSGVVDRIDRVFNDLVGRRQLTLGVGLLAIGLALILGASHALLPGHGKTVMAAYIAGRQGSVRDAVVVGATVTATHTGGVLLLGLALTLSTSLAGESVLGWLGVISGAMIAVLGLSLLRGAIRRRGAPEHVHRHGFGRHTHTHSDHRHSHGDHDHSHGDHDHSHGGNTHAGAVPVLSDHVLLGAGRQAFAMASTGGPAAAGQSPSALALLDRADVPTVLPGVASSPVVLRAEPAHVSRRGLVGMGIAGGLVPSPSALVVLLSAIALGRTVFGVVLVIGYGAGMAATLTAAGVLLVRVRDRYQQRSADGRGRIRSAAARWTRLAPYGTATLVFVVGLGLALRSVGQI